MRRRRFLAATGALLATPALGRGRAGVAQFGPLGEVEIDDTMDAVPSDDGETVYVAATDGFATVDVGDPRSPTVLAERRGLLGDHPDGPLRGIWDVQSDGDRLAVAGPASGTPDLAGFVLYDVTDPAAPQQVAFYETTYPIHNLAFVDGIAYLTGNDGENNPLVAVDCREDTPEAVGRWSLVDHDDQWATVWSYLRSLHDVWVQDGRAYLAHWDAGTWILDVSDPAEMTALARVRGRSPESLPAGSTQERFAEYRETPGNDHYVTVDEDASILAVGAEAWDDPRTDRVGGPGGIELYDVSTPSQPQQVGRVAAPETPDPTTSGVWTTAHNFDLAGDRLYTSWYRGGLTVHDVSDPANPIEVASWADREQVSLFTAMVAEDCVIASATEDPTGIDTTEGLFTFPIPEARPVETTTAATDRPTTDTTTTVDGAEPTRDPTSTAGTRPTTASDATTQDTGDGDGPGFGGLSALAGLTAGGWYALRRRGE